MSEPKEIKTVIAPHLAAGPHGLGDPNDKRLRTSEVRVLIPQLIRKRAREIKCIAEVAEYSKCCKDSGLMMTFNCRPHTNRLKECMGRWYYNEEFIQESTQIYLDERSEYRRTGISKKQKEQMAKAEKEET